MYDAILVPHAGTLEGDIALNHALYIAKFSSSKIILIHVIEEFPNIPTLALHGLQTAKIKRQITELTREMKDTMEKQMITRIESCKKQGINVNLKIATGNASEEILKVVKNQKIELIVMSKRRKLKGFKRLFTLGSVSRKIVENTSCPVLLIDVEKLKPSRKF